MVSPLCSFFVAMLGAFAPVTPADYAAISAAATARLSIF
jgi:hypothetical protein